MDRALAIQEARVEQIANRARLGFIGVMAAVVLMNAPSVTLWSNLINFSAIGIALAYSLAISLWLGRMNYQARMKYATSLIDIALIHLALFAYTLDDIPATALKNPASLIVYPIIGMTVFRCDPRLTLACGTFALLSYAGLFTWAAHFGGINWADYRMELFGPGITMVGQLTKMLILTTYVGLMTLLARYTRLLIHRLVRKEVNTRSRHEKIQKELELASQVQAHLLPRSWPDLAGLSLHAAILEGRSVGGDYYDLIPLSQSSLLLIVADVAGKGVPAALIMSELRSAAHLCATLQLSLEETLERINKLLYESTAPHHYVTAFIATLDIDHHRLRFINAGHPPPLFLSEGQTLRLQQGTFPLGLFSSLPQPEYQQVDLTPGSLLVAYTDGVSERANEAGEEFGDHLLQDFVEENRARDCSSLVQHLLEQLKQHGDHRPFEDDVTLVVAKVWDPALPAGECN